MAEALSLARHGRVRRATDLLLGRAVTLGLAAVALALIVVTFVVLAGGSPFSLGPNTVFGLVLANLVLLLVLGAALAVRLTRVWVERRRGSAGSRLHVRLVLLFSVVAVTPTIVVGVLATAFFNLGIQAWFNDRVRTALEESVQASQGYLVEHRDTIRADALGMANDIQAPAAPWAARRRGCRPAAADQTAMRGLDEAVVYEPSTRAGGRRHRACGARPARLRADAANQAAAGGDVAVLGSPDDKEVRAVVQLNTTPPLMLLIGRPVDPDILDHMHRTEGAVAEYERLDANRSGLQVTFALIFALVALLVLGAAVLIGLVLANQIARPVGRLIRAAERVRAGDLAVRVPEMPSDDEVAGLSRAFNRMTGQLAAQRGELMDAYSQIDERRRFTETVLSGRLGRGDRAGRGGQGGAAQPRRRRAAGRGPARRRSARRWPAWCRSSPTLLARRCAPPERPRTAEVSIGPAIAPPHAAGADRPRAARPAAGRLRRHLRRHHRAAIRAAQGRLGRRGAAHRPRDQEPADPHPARRRAAEAPLRARDHLGPRHLHAVRRHHRARRWATSAAWWTSSPPSPACPQPVMQPEDVGRVAREALVLQRSARPEIAGRPTSPSAARWRPATAACSARR